LPIHIGPVKEFNVSEEASDLNEEKLAAAE
jgi:hypothetical protein